MTNRYFVLILSAIIWPLTDCPSFGDVTRSSSETFREWVRVTDGRQEHVETQLDRLIAQIKTLNLTPCHLKKWVSQFESRTYKNESGLAFLRSKVTEVSETVDAVDRLLKSYLGSAAPVSPRTQVQIRTLAIKIATNEESIEGNTSTLNRILTEVLPSVRSEIEEQRRDIADLVAVVRLAGKEYDRRFDSFCERLADHERRIASLEQSPTQRRGFRYYDGTPVPDPNYSGNAGGQTERPSYTPEYIALERSKICDNARLLTQNYEYRARVSGQVIVYFGDIYHACDGRIVLVKKRRPYVLQ